MEGEGHGGTLVKSLPRPVKSPGPKSSVMADTRERSSNTRNASGLSRAPGTPGSLLINLLGSRAMSVISASLDERPAGEEVSTSW